jgi:hypothetical protein
MIGQFLPASRLFFCEARYFPGKKIGAMSVNNPIILPVCGRFQELKVIAAIF